MRSVRRRLGAALVVAAVVMFAGGLSGCTNGDSDNGGDVTGAGGDATEGPSATTSIHYENTGKPTLYEVHRGPDLTDPLVAAIMDQAGNQQGQVCYSPAMLPIGQPEDSLHEIGPTPPAGGLCAEYGPQLPGARIADYEGDPSNRMNDQPCPE